MPVKAHEFVVKVSVSDMQKSKAFYSEALGFAEQKIYTINSGGHFGMESYMQLELAHIRGSSFAIGLYKDIDVPYDPLPQTGSVPSFLVDDIEASLQELKAKGVKIDEDGGSAIITNVSDKGYEDKFFFFRDPDNNSLVMRQNFGRHAPDEVE